MNNTQTEQLVSEGQLPTCPSEKTVTSQPSPFIKSLTLGIVFMLEAMHAGKFLRQGHWLEVAPYAVGSMLGPIILTGVVFLIFQIFKKFRTPRARWLIVLWVNVILLAGELNRMAQIFFGN